MDALENVKELLSQYASEVGFSSLDLDENNQCALTYDDKYTVNFGVYEDDGLIVFASSLGDLPSGNKEEFFETILEANGFAIPTQGAALGINADERIVTLTRAMPTASLNYQILVESLNQFVDKVEEWCGIIENIKYGTPATPQSSGDVPSFPAESPGFRV